MEPISKREFYTRYANKRDKRNIWGAAILAYICAALSLLLGVVLQNYSVMLDVLLIVGLTLGMQLAKNRVCAVLLLVYSCINTIIVTIGSGQVSGWLLIVAGIFAVIGTFNLHKDYQNFLQNSSAYGTNTNQVL